MGTNFEQFYDQLALVFPSKQLITDELYRYAYGTDASCYRLTPKLVVKVASERQMQQLLQMANQYQVALTFRAAGTSLSGQAVTDSVLVMLTDDWQQLTIEQDGAVVTVQPGVIAARVNKALAPFRRKIGPDPASINSCKIGGVAANNASGMCCGVKHNSYHTLADMRLVLADGSVLDTRDQVSINAFCDQHTELLTRLQQLHNYINQQAELKQKIQHKYRIKNTTGYGLNALVDFTEPLDMLTHLMIGSEGTLGFISNISYRTLPIANNSATALYVFDTIEIACQAVALLASQKVSAVELMDDKSLLAVGQLIQQVLPELELSKLPQGVALLIELEAEQTSQLAENIKQIEQVLSPFQPHLLGLSKFSDDPELQQQLWAIRKGLFPAVGANRAANTCVIIEDVAVDVAQLAEVVHKLKALFAQFGFEQAIIFGHALAGNLHFVFTPSFESEQQIQQYHHFMQALSQLIAVEYQGSLKAEHGTGRNMAPFVEQEWGSELYQVMWQIKQAFDPNNILNPEVMLSHNAKLHIQALKQLPSVDSSIDRCIECGFCEVVCPSKNLTLTPRQRISAARHYQPQHNLKLPEHWQYAELDSCAATGMCAQPCPVGIDTGAWVKQQRAKQAKHNKLANFSAKHFQLTNNLAATGLTFIRGARKLLGEQNSRKVNHWLKHKIATNWPEFKQDLGDKVKLNWQQLAQPQFEQQVVYFPSCINRTIGASSGAEDSRALPEVIQSLLAKAQIGMIMPQQLTELCCGMPWQSKGYVDIAQQKQQQIFNALWQASHQGKLVIITDASPCALNLAENANQLTIFNAVEYIERFVADKLVISAQVEPIMLHVTCSSKKQNQGKYLRALAQRCSKQVIEPEDIYCCGFAGDKGFSLPELNQSALASLAKQIPTSCIKGVSDSRSCEIGLTQHGGITYQSILYLLDKLSCTSSA